MENTNNTNQNGVQQNSSPAPANPASGLTPNVAGALCYLVGWITGIFFFMTSKDKYVRFHALQSIIVFGAGSVLSFVPFVNLIVGLVLLVLWVVLMVKAYQGEKFKLPVIGDIAEKNA